MNKKILIVVDYQNDFINGVLGFKEAVEIKPFIINKIKEYQKSNSEIIFLKDTHDENYLNTIEGKKLPIVHTIKNTHGWDLPKEIIDLVGNNKVFEKNAFGSTLLFEYLKNKEYDSIELCGLLSNMCVLANAIIAKTCCPNAKIIIDKKCTTTISKDLNNKTLEIMKNLHFDII